jgi:transposase
MGIFARMMEGMASGGDEDKVVMTDAAHLKAHRTASSLSEKGGGANDRRGRLIRRTKGGLNTKQHTMTDAKGRRLRFLMTARQVSDDTGAAAIRGNLPAAEWRIADRGYDAAWFRGALKSIGIRPCVPGRKSRGKTVRHDRRHNRIEIMFGRQKTGRRTPLRQVPQGLPPRRRLGRTRPVLALKINQSAAQVLSLRRTSMGARMVTDQPTAVIE